MIFLHKNKTVGPLSKNSERSISKPSGTSSYGSNSSAALHDACSPVNNKDTTYHPCTSPGVSRILWPKLSSFVKSNVFPPSELSNLTRNPRMRCLSPSISQWYNMESTSSMVTGTWLSNSAIADKEAPIISCVYCVWFVYTPRAIAQMVWMLGLAHAFSTSGSTRAERLGPNRSRSSNAARSADAAHVSEEGVSIASSRQYTAWRRRSSCWSSCIAPRAAMEPRRACERD